MTASPRRSPLLVLGALWSLAAAGPLRAADAPAPSRAQEAAPTAVHLVGHEEAALLRRVQDVIDDWDPRKLVNPYVETVIPADPTKGIRGQKVLRRKDLGQFIADVAAAEALGKAFFWDMQAGSDFRREGGAYVGTACASCHYRFGADARDRHTTRIPYVAWEHYYRDPKHPLEFGETPRPYAVRAVATKSIGTLDELYLPRPSRQVVPRRAGGDEADAAPADEDEGRRTPLTLVVGSQGVKPRIFRGLTYGNRPDAGAADWPSERSDPRLVGPFQFYKPDWSMFIEDQDDTKQAFRQITARNAPTVINSGFADRLFHDARAESTFNGFSIFGDFDRREVIHVRRRADGRLVPTHVAISNAALASQAVGPVVNDLEMSYVGRTFHHLAAKLLDAPVLGYQEVSPTDSHLGRFKAEGLVGPDTTYRELIRRAFRPEWWDGRLGAEEQQVPLGLAEANPDGTLPTGPLMEANFSLFWGLSLLLYQADLVSNDTPFDRMLRGDGKAVDDAWGRHRAALETMHIDRVRTTNPPPDGKPQFPFRFGTEALQRGFRLFMNRGCIECHAGPLLSEVYDRNAATEPAPPIAFTLERTLLPNSRGDAIALPLERRREAVRAAVRAELIRVQPKEPRLADRVVREVELLRDTAHGSQSRLAEAVDALLSRAGYAGIDAAPIARSWLEFEKSTPRYSGGRLFFPEAERVARADRLVDPLLVELMPIPPNQVEHRRPLPIAGPVSRDGYAFYDLGFYDLGVAPPRYDRGIGTWSAPEPEEEVAQAVVAALAEGAEPELARVGEALKGAYDLKEQAERARLAEALTRGPAAGQELTPPQQKALAGLAAKVAGAAEPTRSPTQSASGSPGEAYRFRSRSRAQPPAAPPAERPRPPAAEALTPPPPAAARKPGDRVPGVAGDPDAKHHDDRPRDVSWFRDLPNWDDLFPDQPTPPFDSQDTRRSEVHFFSRARALAQDESPWGHRKPFLHDNELAFWGAFKTPTLRNVELTPPYMHNGRLLTLLDVVDFYDRGGDLPAQRDVNPDKHPAIRGLNLSVEDKLALYFFLLCLTDERVRHERAPFDHPALRVVNGYEPDLRERVFDLNAVGAEGQAAGPRRSFPSPD